MGIPLRILIVEDSTDDALLLVRQVQRGGYDVTFEQVDTAAGMKAALECAWDVVISDYSLPGFDGLAALALFKEKELDLPFIIVSGTIGEDIAVEAMKAGAHDYLMKGNLTRLVPAIQRELREAQLRRERKHHEREREAIITISNALRTAPTRAEMLPVLLDRLNDLFAADGTMLAMRDLASGEIIFEEGRGTTGVKFSGFRMAPGAGISGLVIATGQPYWSNNVHNDSRFARPDLLGNSNAFACVPLIAQEQTIGALSVLRRTDLTENEVRLLAAVADIVANAIFRVTLHEQTERQLKRLAALHQIDMAISANMDLPITLNVLLTHVITQLGVDAADVLLLNPYTQILEYAAGQGYRTPGIEQTRLRLGEGQAGTAAFERRVISLPEIARSEIMPARLLVIAGEGFVSHFIAPLIAKGQVKGVLETFHRKRLAPGPEWLDFFETLATQAAIAIDNGTLFDNLQRSNEELKVAYDTTIEGWSRALDLRDRETEGHTQRVTEMMVDLACAMGITGPELKHHRRGALLHDIGKMGIPDSILLKPGPLSDEEWKLMRKHPLYAYELLSSILYLRRALDIPYCHHEKWDGTGYPRGLKGEEIPLGARIFAVVDVWDALRSDRPYHRAWNDAAALAYIREQTGKHFDPGVVEVFLKMIKA